MTESSLLEAGINIFPPDLPWHVLPRRFQSNCSRLLSSSGPILPSFRPNLARVSRLYHSFVTAFRSPNMMA